MTTMERPPSPDPEIIPSVEPKDGPKEEQKQTGKSVFMKMRLIGQIVVEYFIDLFNRSSRDFREVSNKLSEMKSQDKIEQQEERIRTQNTATTVSKHLTIMFFKIVVF